ncbi:MAG: glycosyltransferase family 25 protein [Holosporales bacterium]|jgi:GR25 family glycosyltransferase involved in LPS biosynthesis|nr:glycosyltransferase family 25 protein [Holosporales bacterium]
MIGIKSAAITSIIILVIAVIVRAGIFVLRDSPKFDEKVYSAVGNGSVHAYFINLEQSKDRLTKLLPKLQKLGIEFTRIPGVYGAALSDDEKEAVADRRTYIRLMHNPLGDGTIGCYLSHINAWKAFLESEHSYAMIFEDDVEFVPDSLRHAIDTLVKNSHLWDIITFDYIHYGHPRQLISLPTNPPESVSCFVDPVLECSCTSVYTPLLRSVSPSNNPDSGGFNCNPQSVCRIDSGLQCSGTPFLGRVCPNPISIVKFRTRVGNAGCYLINRKAAIKLLSKALPIMMPVDHYFVRSWEFGLRFVGVAPKLVSQDSSVSIRKQQDHKARVPIKYRILSVIHQALSQAATCIYAYLG